MTEEISCPYRSFLEKFGFYWCSRYHIVTPIFSPLCHGCLSEDPTIRSVLENQSAVFKNCNLLPDGDHFCTPFNMTVDDDTCLRCRADVEFRVHLVLSSRRRVAESLQGDVLESIERWGDSVSSHWEEVKSLLPVGLEEEGQIITDALRGAIDKERKRVVGSGLFRPDIGVING